MIIAMKKIYLMLLILPACVFAQAQENGYTLVQNISYVPPDERDAYRKERCLLDAYYPTDVKGFTTIVWFHGGGLEGGQKELPLELQNKGVAVVSPNYRLSPKATNPAYIDDAAAAVAWVFENIESFGGDPARIYVAGHSAGGYLTLMIGLDKSYLQKYGVDADRIKGLIPASGQTNTHYTIRKERGLPMDIPLVDEYAPLNKVRAGLPPILLITGDRHLEMTARYEENLHLESILRYFGNKDLTLYELQGFDHGGMAIPACRLLINWVKKHDQK